MLNRAKRSWSLYGKPEISLTGRESGAYLSKIRAVLSYRSAEESGTEGISYATETAYALIPDRYAPRGGFQRGMLLCSDGEKYRMLTPVRHGRLWSVKCIRIHI